MANSIYQGKIIRQSIQSTGKNVGMICLQYVTWGGEAFILLIK